MLLNTKNLIILILSFLFTVEGLNRGRANNFDSDEAELVEPHTTRTITTSLPTPPPPNAHGLPSEEEYVITITAKLPNPNMRSQNVTLPTKANNSTSHEESKESESEKHMEKEFDEGETLRKKDPVGTSAMFVVGLITTSLNFVSCGYLLYLVRKLTKKVGFHSSLRMLTYSVVVDLLVGGFFTLSIVYSTLFDHLISGSYCQLIGFLINTLEAADMLLIGFLALSTYLKIVKGYDLPKGRYDWFLLSFVLGVPLTFSIVLAQFHAFGPEEFWCLIDDDTLAGTISTISILGLYLMIALILLVSYIKVKQFKRNQHSGSHTHQLPKTQFSTLNVSFLDNNQDSILSPKTEKERERLMNHQINRKSILTLSYAEVKIDSHLKIHFFQYTPPCIHFLCMLLGYRSAWVFAFAILSTNLSGVFQLIAYLHHQKEKKKDFKKFLYSESHSGKFNGEGTTLSKGERVKGSLVHLKELNPSYHSNSPLKNSHHSVTFDVDEQRNPSRTSVNHTLTNLKYPTISSTSNNVILNRSDSKPSQHIHQQ